MPETQHLDQGESFIYTPTAMANGGKTVGRDPNDRALFVPLTIPGEEVRVEIVDSKPRYAHAKLLEVLDPSTERTEPRCPHFGICGGCHFQHIDYQAQLEYKKSVVIDQLRRIGKFAQVSVNDTLPNPEPWSYSTEVTFHRTTEERLGFWSNSLQEIIPIDTCTIIKADLLELYQQVDLNLPSLRQLTLRVGDNGDLLAALDVDSDEAPSLLADVPVSINLVLPDGKTVNMVGDNHTIREIKGRVFRVTAGSFIFSSSRATELLIDTVLEYASLSDQDRVVELDSGVGLLTAFLAQSSQSVVGVESSEDAIADLAANLDDFDNVTIFQGFTEEIVPDLDESADVLVVQPPAAGITPFILDEFARLDPDRLIYVSSDIATLARDGRRLAEKSFKLVEIQPIDMWPQTYHTLTVSLWKRSS